MSEVEVILSIIVIFLVFLNILQLQINVNTDKRFRIVSQWLMSNSKATDTICNVLISHGIDNIKEPNYYDKSTTQTTQAAKAEARTC